MKWLTLHAAVLLSVSVLSAAGVSSQASSMAVERPAPPARCEMVCLSDRDDGRTLHLRSGEFVHLALHSNPSTGYAWHLSELDTEVVDSLCNGFTSDHPGLFGTSGNTEWFFRAVARGETWLVLSYYRPLEGAGSAIGSMTVRIIVD